MRLHGWLARPEIMDQHRKETLFAHADFADREAHRHRAAILVAALKPAQAVRAFRRQIRCETLIEAITGQSWQQQHQIAADQFLSLVAEQSGRLRTERAQRAVLIDGEDAARLLSAGLIPAIRGHGNHPSAEAASKIGGRILLALSLHVNSEKGQSNYFRRLEAVARRGVRLPIRQVLLPFGAILAGVLPRRSRPPPSTSPCFSNGYRMIR